MNELAERRKGMEELSERLHSLEKTIVQLTTIFEQTHKSIVEMNLSHAKRIEELEILVSGNHAVKGHQSRIETLEEAEDSRKWTLRTMWAAIVSMLVKIFWDLLYHKV